MVVADKLFNLVYSAFKLRDANIGVVMLLLAILMTWSCERNGL
jgi:hypothetical protein